MKCPSCGKQIKEGNLYCDNCGTEIRFVPEFDPEVENKINESLSGMAQNLQDESIFYTREMLKKEALEEEQKARKYLPVYLAVAAAFIVGFLIFLFFGGKHDALSYEEQAQEYYVDGNYDKAINSLYKALDSTSKDNVSARAGLLFKLYGYQHEAGYDEDAEATLDELSDESVFDEDTVTSAIDTLISHYESLNEYDKIHELLVNCKLDSITKKYDKYLPAAPVFSEESGEYNEVLNISLFSKSEGSIYYTVNGADPDENSIKYSDELVLEEEGEYDIRAVLINSYGIKSDISNEFYILENVGPAAPEIMEDSGEYSQSTMIAAVCDSTCQIFYTTDGTDPTAESKVYTAPITMPVGTTVFKFVAVDEEGRLSEIVERKYHLTYTRLVSIEQAKANVISTLVKLDILLDSQGKVRGEEGHYDYVYSKDVEIAGSGEYYVFVETHVFNDGSTKETGLLYAVNTHDGKVNRLGYDSSGNYTLITISNR